MVARQMNLDASGNQGLAATCKIQLCRESAMLYHFLVNLLKTTKMTRFRIKQDKYVNLQMVTNTLWLWGVPKCECFCLPLYDHMGITICKR